MSSHRLWLLPVSLLFACVEAPDAVRATAPLPLGSPGTAVVVGPPWEHPTVRVCWTQGGGPMSSLEIAAVADELDWLEALIHAAWEPTIGVTWTFERDCVGGYDVALDLWGDHGLAWGRALRDAPPLGIDLRDYGEAPGDRHARLRAEALRSSGRVLGLEWIAADDGEPCATPFLRGCTDASPLAPSAVAAAVTLYGPAFHRMIAPTGQCLTSGAQGEAQVGDCGTVPQAWPDRFAGVGVNIFHEIGGGWLGRPEPAGPLRFSGTAVSRFELHAQIRVTGGLCLVAYADEPAPRLGACVESGDHPAIINLPGGSSGVCIEPEAPTPGALVVNAPCVGDAPPWNQAWNMMYDGRLRHAVTQLCLTPADLGVDGSLLTLEPCEGLTRQRFMLSAALDDVDGNYGVDAPATEVEAPTAIGAAAPVGAAPVEHRRYTLRTFP